MVAAKTPNDILLDLDELNCREISDIIPDINQPNITDHDGLVIALDFHFANYAYTLECDSLKWLLTDAGETGFSIFTGRP